MEFRGFMGGFYRLTEWIMRFSVINLLWIICSLPFFILGLIAWTAETLEITKHFLFLMAILSPITIIPATSAMFVVARKWVLGEEDVPLLKTFFRGYKDNYKQSILGGLIYVIVFGIFYVNYTFYVDREGMLQSLSMLFIFLMILWSASLYYFFALTSHVHMKIMQTLKNAFMITIGRPLTTIMIVITNFGIMFISLRFSFLIVFFSGSVSAYLTFMYFLRMFNKIQDLRESLDKEALESEEAKETEEVGRLSTTDHDKV